MFKFDHHVHTSRHSPDSDIDPYDLLERASEVGLDGVVITEHDYQWEQEELAELASYGAKHGVKVFSGAEVSAREGHFLVYGLPNLDDAPAGVTLKELIAVVRRHDAAIVAAHPFRWDQDFDAIVSDHGPAFDALELVSNNITIATRTLTDRLLSKHKMGATGSSDGHEILVVGCYYTWFPRPIESLADFVGAIRAREGTPGHREHGPLLSGPVLAAR